MSLTKEFYHDQICQGQMEAMQADMSEFANEFDNKIPSDEQLDEQFEDYMKKEANRFRIKVGNKLTPADHEKISAAIKAEDDEVDKLAFENDNIHSVFEDDIYQ